MNRLSNSTSPYLLQHAHNPVDWFPWDEEALAKSRAEDKPIFLSIGYAACHWCHVMAHESFEDEQTAAYMNEHFINIKVDREERPDIDGIYMQTVVAMTGSGGWPLSVFLAPDLKPFYAGTYFPPVRRYNMPSFMEVVTGLANAWQNDRSQIEEVGGKIMAHLQHQNQPKAGGLLTREHFDAIAKSMTESYDWGYGGWGSAPKFPQAMALEFLLQHAAFTKQPEHHKLITHCLQAMSRGGMYDVVGGGFSRYSTDNFWRVPHFDNKWFTSAVKLADEMIEKFSDPDGGFFDTPQDGETLLIRPKDIADNATPSGNALACEALLKLAAFTDDGKYRDLAEQTLTIASETALRYPLGFARWLSAAENAHWKTNQLAVLGEAESLGRLLKVIRAEYRPGVVTAASVFPPEKDAPALLHGRGLVFVKATAYVCEGFVCKQLTNDPEALAEQLGLT
jgi:uncharacterized protein YyaL (SSP411 family)